MATQVQFRRGTATQNNSFTGAAGEISINTTNDTIRVHDGSTQGGAELAKADLSNTSSVGTLTATTFSGNLTGNVTGNASGTAGGLSGTPDITVGTVTAATLDISGNVDVDGTLEADAITIDGTSLAETISDTVGAMVSSNTETNITVTYDDSDNTLDFVIGTLNQDTTGNAGTATSLATARTLSVSGAGTGSVSFDGSANADISLTLANSGVTAATYGSSSAIPIVTVDRILKYHNINR